MNNIRNFLWGTFNYRNKGMKWINRVETGYHFMKIRNGKLYSSN